MKEEIKTIIDGYNAEKLHLVKIISGIDSGYQWEKDNTQNAKERIKVIDEKIDEIVKLLLVTK